jgi:hypothetical protein
LKNQSLRVESAWCTQAPEWLRGNTSIFEVVALGSIPQLLNKKFLHIVHSTYTRALPCAVLSLNNKCRLISSNTSSIELDVVHLPCSELALRARSRDRSRERERERESERVREREREHCCQSSSSSPSLIVITVIVIAVKASQHEREREIDPERERVFFALNGILCVPVVFLLWGILKDLRQF